MRPEVARAAAWQIWNDFLFGIVFSGVDSMPITVALNNLVNTSTGVKEYNVDMAGAIIAALAHAAGLHHRRTLFRARPDGGRSEGLPSC